MDFSKAPLRVAGIIPARYASTRFPGKPLAMISGMSMIERVYKQGSACSLINTVVVATDDQRISEHVKSFGGRVIMTSSNHQSGTDRIGETLNILSAAGEKFDIAVNIQGDEPFIQPAQIEKVISLFGQAHTQIATLIKKIESDEELFNPNVVKVVTDKNGRAMLFSRSPIPYVRGQQESMWAGKHSFYKHIGIYAYQTQILEQLVKLAPAPGELAESLEQLRWLWNGYTIYTETTEFETFGIDTPEDLSKLTNNS